MKANKMTEIPKKDLPKYIGQEIILKEGAREMRIIFTKYQCWLEGFNITDHSLIQILLTGKDGENAPKFYIK